MLQKKVNWQPCSRIISGFQKKFTEFDFETECSVSIGIAQTPEDGMEFNKLFTTQQIKRYTM